MIKLREANIQDLEILLFWDKQEHVIESDPNDDWNWDYELRRTPNWREQLIAEYNKRPIGFIQIIDPAEEESHYWGNIEKGKRAIDIWIGENKDLRKGYGTEMMKLAIERCFVNLEVNEILIDPLESNKKAIKFYTRLGFQFVEKRRFEEDNCEVHSLKRHDWKKKQLTQHPTKQHRSVQLIAAPPLLQTVGVYAPARKNFKNIY